MIKYFKEDKLKCGVYLLVLWMVVGCSVKKNTIFSRSYHQLTTRYNVYFNGNEALKAGIKKMEQHHKEDYTDFLPVFVSNDDRTRGAGKVDMEYAMEKALKAIDKHSITAKPKRRKDKEPKDSEAFQRKKEHNNQLDLCYLLLGKSLFYQKKYAMANNTFRSIQRLYAYDRDIVNEAALWMFRSFIEMGRYDEAKELMQALDRAVLNGKQREMYVAAKTDLYIRREEYPQAIGEAERLTELCRDKKCKSRYRFLLSQLYMKENRDRQAIAELRKIGRFNFNYEMVFNAKINRALAYQEGDRRVVRVLNRMLRDVKNIDYQDRIYYALAGIEEKGGNEEAAVDLYWQSVRASVSNDNQQSLSFRRLGDYYFKRQDYVCAQACYDSCLFLMDSRHADYDRLKELTTDLTDLVVCIKTIQEQDSLQQLAAMPANERNKLVDEIIRGIKDREEERKKEVDRAQTERYFYQRNDMLSRGSTSSQGGGDGSEWYFYNPVTVMAGKNDFSRKWGRRKQEDHWRRQNKAMVDFIEPEIRVAENREGDKGRQDIKSRDYYVRGLPLTPELLEISNEKIAKAYHKAGEIYIYRFGNYKKALECFEAYIGRFPDGENLPLLYYLAYNAAEKLNDPVKMRHYQDGLTGRFPQSDYAKGLDDPDYFENANRMQQLMEHMYEDAYDKYQQVYYEDALAICDDILKKYPGNVLNDKVLFLRAMCVVNLRGEREAEEALNVAIAAKPEKEMLNTLHSILAMVSAGEKPVFYSDEAMADARALQANRRWVFGAEENVGKKEEGVPEQVFKVEKEKEHIAMIILPEDIGIQQINKIQARLDYINASELAGSDDYEMDKSDLWDKTPVLLIRGFSGSGKALIYLNRIGTDKQLLKIIGDKDYRIVAITEDNLTLLTHLRNVEEYADFFIIHYFEDRERAEVLTGKQGIAAHIFGYEEDEKHNFVLLLPFKEVNTKQIADALRDVERSFALVKENYDDKREMMVVKNVGTKAQAMEYMTLAMRNKDIVDRLSGVSYQAFVITQQNQAALLEGAYLEEYLKFFEDNYMSRAEETGVGNEDFVYNKSVNHKFVLFYPNKIDPFKLKSVFEAFNFTGLTINNIKYDDGYDYMVVSGFNNRDEAMRYLNMVAENQKLLKPLKDIDYTNFIITEVNLKVMQEKHLIKEYLDFFKRYYLQ